MVLTVMPVWAIGENGFELDISAMYHLDCCGIQIAEYKFCDNYREDIIFVESSSSERIETIEILEITLDESVRNVNSDTEITEENIYAVLRYLGIDSDRFTMLDYIEQNNTPMQSENMTVQDLIDAILSVEIREKSVENFNGINPTNNITMTRSGGIFLSHTWNWVAGWTYTIACTGHFSSDDWGSWWTGVSGINNTMNDPFILLGVSYRITDDNSTYSFTRNVIRIDNDFYIVGFITVANVGVIEVTRNRVTGHVTFVDRNHLCVGNHTLGGWIPHNATVHVRVCGHRLCNFIFPASGQLCRFLNGQCLDCRQPQRIW